MSRSISIPLRDSPDEVGIEHDKRLQRFAIEVWNLTQNWANGAVDAASYVQEIANSRLRMFYARRSTSDTSMNSTNTKEDQASETLSQEERHSTMKTLVTNLAKVAETMEELERVIEKFRTAKSRLSAWRELCPKPSARVANILEVLEQTLPSVIKMYTEELAAKRAALADMADLEHRDVLAMAALTFLHEPFVDQEVIEIQFDDLPDGNEVLEILKAEKAALHFWIRLAMEYYRQDRGDEFVRILEVSGSEAFLEYEDVETDQMRALDILAAYFVRQGHKERSKERKKELFNRATLLYTTADKINMYDRLHLTGRAYYCLVEGKTAKLDQASQQFNFVLKQNQNDIPAMLGMACISFNKRDYKTALYYYKKALSQKPDGPADIRVGIGYCLARMGKPDKAEIAFLRALQLDAENVSALTALAILNINKSTEKSIGDAVNQMHYAYTIETENPVLLVHLGNHFFYREDFDRAEKLAWHAMSITESDQIKAEACHLLAKCFHNHKYYEKAFKYYYQATTLNHPTFILPYYGLGQLYIQRGEYGQAINAFETIMKVQPNNPEVMKVLASLYAHSDPNDMEKKAKARELFLKLLQLTPDDIEVNIDVAQLLEAHDPQKSLALYERVVQLLADTESIEAPPEIVNNMGSLHMNLGCYEKAQTYFIQAETLVQNELSAGYVDDQSLLVTIRYNLARCLEHLCQFNEAEHMYKGIVKQKDNYIDCIMRLGCLARDRGQIFESSVWFKEAMSINQGDSNAWTMIGNLHMAKHEWGPAQKKFEHILKLEEGKNDAYSCVALGNIWLEMLFNPNRQRNDDRKYVDRALTMYTKAIKHQPKNMWAANGIGCIMAFKSQWLEARDIFSQVREATADFYDVWINIAHVYMETRQYMPAIQMYSNAMKKFGKDNDPMALLYLSRAYYKAQRMPECRETLEKAMSETADNVQVKFNYAFVMKKMALAALKEQKATVEMVTGAIDDLNTAERIFTYISEVKDESLSGIRYVSRTTAGSEGSQCSDLLKQAQMYLTQARQRDEEDSRIRQKQQQQMQAMRQQMEDEQRAQEQQRLEKLEAMKNLRQSYMEMTKDILVLPEIAQEKKSRGGGGRGRKKGGDGEEFVNDSSDMGDWVGENGEPRERKKKDKASKKASRKRRERDDQSGGDSGDDARKEERRRRKKEADARKAEAKLSSKQSAKIKSRAYISDSDSSDGNAPKISAPAPAVNSDDDDVPGPSKEFSSSDLSSGEESDPKPRKKKPATGDSDESSEPPIIGSSDDDDAPLTAAARRVESGSGSDESDVSPKKKRVLHSDDDSD